MVGEFWNELYREEGYRYGEKPNEFLEHRHTLIPKDSRVLVLGDGEGRNGVFLARKRCQVTTIDASEVAVEKAKALAAKNKVDVNIIHGVLPDVEIEKGVWDVVVLIFVHLPEKARKATHRLAVEALKPGGLLILEAYTPEQLNNTSGGPKDEALLYTIDMLKEDFKGLDFEGVAELETMLDEGVGHQGKANVVRFIAVKPE